MKLSNVILLAALTCGCHHDKPAPTTPPAVAAQPAPDTTKNQKVSHTLAMSPELVQQCGIKLTESAANPKFAFDKDELSTDDRNVLEQLATCMTTGALAKKSVELVGRADPRGTEQYNLALGSRRASSVNDYLQHLGVAASQLTQMTRGDIDATGTTEAGWANDRRVDLDLIRS